MFNGKEKVRRTYVEKRILTTATGVQEEISRERRYIRRLQKNNPFSSKIII